MAFILFQKKEAGVMPCFLTLKVPKAIFVRHFMWINVKEQLREGKKVRKEKISLYVPNTISLNTLFWGGGGHGGEVIYAMGR